MRAEHVIPRSVLDLVTPKSPGSFPLILDVHPVCDEKYKAPRDQLAKIVGMTSPREWTKEELGLFRKQCDVRRVWVGGWEAAPVIDNADEILYGAYLWARGCHAALYGEAIPWPSDQWTSCPAPSYRADSADPHADMREDRVRTNGVLGAIANAMRRGEVDTVSLVGGAIEYNCVWVQSPDEPEDPWMCMWAMDLPGAERWSRDTRGREVPWHGVYASPTKPVSASVVTVAPEGS